MQYIQRSASTFVLAITGILGMPELLYADTDALHIPVDEKALLFGLTPPEKVVKKIDENTTAGSSINQPPVSTPASYSLRERERLHCLDFCRYGKSSYGQGGLGSTNYNMGWITPEDRRAILRDLADGN